MMWFVWYVDGLDFYYQQQQDARKLVEFLQSVVPCRSVLQSAHFCLLLHVSKSYETGIRV